MSKIREKILRDERPTGTIEDLAEWLVESFLTLSPSEQAQVRKEILGNYTLPQVKELYE